MCATIYNFEKTTGFLSISDILKKASDMNVSRKLLVLLFSLLPVALSAQNDDSETSNSDFDEFRNSILGGFNSSRSQIMDDYDNFRSQMMKDYVEFVRQAWSEFNVEPTLPVPEEKPVPPVVMPDEERDEQPDERPLLVDEIIAPLPFTPQPRPVVEIDEIPTLHEEYVYFTFFGTDAKVRFPVSDKVIVKGSDENSVADAIETMTSRKYDNTLFDCLMLRKELKLSDWAYLQMLGALAEKIYGNDNNSATMMSACLYMQSGYKVRFGENEGKLYMLFACEGYIYNRDSYTVDGCLYYGLEELPVRMHICKASLIKEQELSLVVKGGQRFSYKKSDPRRIASKKYPEIAAEVSVNENLMRFYESYPTSFVGENEMTRWAMYANAELDESVKQALYPKLQAIVKGLSQVEALNRILDFVQTGLVYGYDNEIWGEDRAFFSEESLYYPYCDCEDRSILFSRIVRDLLGLDVALVMVPGHMLVAVNLKEDVQGAYVMLDGRKFVLCEPTCLNGAPVGWADIEDGARLQLYLLERTESQVDYTLEEQPMEVEHSLIPYFDGAKWGYKNNAGEVVVKCEYDSVSDNALYGDRHLYVAKLGSRLYLYDPDGFYICNCDGYVPLDLNRIDGVKSDYYGIFNDDGQWYINDLVFMVPAGMVLLDEYDMESVTYENNIFCRLPAENEFMERFIILKRKSDGKWGVIDIFGKTVLPFEYDRIEFSPNDKSVLLLYNALSGEEHTHKL